MGDTETSRGIVGIVHVTTNVKGESVHSINKADIEKMILCTDDMKLTLEELEENVATNNIEPVSEDDIQK